MAVCGSFVMMLLIALALAVLIVPSQPLFQPPAGMFASPGNKLLPLPLCSPVCQFVVRVQSLLHQRKDCCGLDWLLYS